MDGNLCSLQHRHPGLQHSRWVLLLWWCRRCRCCCRLLLAGLCLEVLLISSQHCLQLGLQLIHSRGLRLQLLLELWLGLRC